MRSGNPGGKHVSDISHAFAYTPWRQPSGTSLRRMLALGKLPNGAIALVQSKARFLVALRRTAGDGWRWPVMNQEYNLCREID